MARTILSMRRSLFFFLSHFSQVIEIMSFECLVSLPEMVYSLMVEFLIRIEKRFQDQWCDVTVVFATYGGNLSPEKPVFDAAARAGSISLLE